ncbi:hypothetical protein [Blastococcus sp. CCUG 61487]|uniref:hypothetical protein n=1 Tax=Blastococcus sp. CCUG 61487 TaxID=1840703 RepID=UPI0010C0F875|nr:hypothetical protein [Blastococcus sp. CCUG 61487]TKJ31405.1 hypothetical protein A6V29_18425 [Blastococcus sp. CCUG 61487]
MPTDSSPLPGSLTVPPLHGWLGIAALLVLAVVVGVGYLVVRAAGHDDSESSEWLSWLDGRSRTGVVEEPADPGHAPVPLRRGS